MAGDGRRPEGNVPDGVQESLKLEKEVSDMTYPTAEELADYPILYFELRDLTPDGQRLWVRACSKEKIPISEQLDAIANIGQSRHRAELEEKMAAIDAKAYDDGYEAGLAAAKVPESSR